jgi:hypothetical protein
MKRYLKKDDRKNGQIFKIYMNNAFCSLLQEVGRWFGPLSPIVFHNSLLFIILLRSYFIKVHLIKTDGKIIKK